PAVCHQRPLSLPHRAHSLAQTTATTPTYTLSLHDALPISTGMSRVSSAQAAMTMACRSNWSRAPLPLSVPSANRYAGGLCSRWGDRKSTRLNSSHVKISYAVFCLKKKKQELGRTVGRVTAG